jgi:hypothetical protein
MYYIKDIRILSNTANIEIMDDNGDTFAIREVKRINNRITIKPTRQLKQGTLKPLEQELKDIIRGGWAVKDVELIY